MIRPQAVPLDGQDRPQVECFESCTPELMKGRSGDFLRVEDLKTLIKQCIKELHTKSDVEVSRFKGREARQGAGSDSKEDEEIQIWTQVPDPGQARFKSLSTRFTQLAKKLEGKKFFSEPRWPTGRQTNYSPVRLEPTWVSLPSKQQLNPSVGSPLAYIPSPNNMAMGDLSQAATSSQKVRSSSKGVWEMDYRQQQSQELPLVPVEEIVEETLLVATPIAVVGNEVHSGNVGNCLDQSRELGNSGVSPKQMRRSNGEVLLGNKGKASSSAAEVGKDSKSETNHSSWVTSKLLGLGTFLGISMEGMEADTIKFLEGIE
ncbi:PREDICTED: uncharacterized protein LOC104600550 [Nelumbo nucifera]|uniref:Uncharacterized protein LOC104600550 n=1 Tax=Nelumbo nucifera TaxID=4432 RepID=A0A1U8Q709_NELNU|nr:PREDICTED: uncharacterized protein LOC104600550 [Nelumbo nucifera]